MKQNKKKVSICIQFIYGDCLWRTNTHCRYKSEAHKYFWRIDLVRKPLNTNQYRRDSGRCCLRKNTRPNEIDGVLIWPFIQLQFPKSNIFITFSFPRSVRFRPFIYRFEYILREIDRMSVSIYVECTQRQQNVSRMARFWPSVPTKSTMIFEMLSLPIARMPHEMGNSIFDNAIKCSAGNLHWVRFVVFLPRYDFITVNLFVVVVVIGFIFTRFRISIGELEVTQ